MFLLYNKAMHRQTFFSVVIPSFNRRQLLGKAIDSALSQTFPDFEIIVIDDGSTDGTDALLASYSGHRMRILRQRNHGVSHARNRGIEASRGRFIAFLDSDDRWMPEKLECVVDHIKRYPGVKIFHTKEIWSRGGSLLHQKEKHRNPTGMAYPMSLPICCISVSTAVVARDLFSVAGMFDESMEACEDYDFWLRVTSCHEVALIPEPLTIKDGGRPDQLSSSVWGLDRFRVKALEKMLSSGELKEDYYRLTLDELRKKCAIFAAGAEKRGDMKKALHYLSIPDKY
jgi:hypothetical protein